MTQAQDCRAEHRLSDLSWEGLEGHLAWLIDRLEAAGHGAADAQDLAQEAILRAAHLRERGQVLERVDGWLLVVARNLGRDLLRRRERHTVESLEEVPEPAVRSSMVQDGACLPPSEELHRAFCALSERDRLVLWSWVVREGEPDRVAVDLGVRRELVKVRLFRARRRLRALMEETP